MPAGSGQGVAPQVIGRPSTTTAAAAIACRTTERGAEQSTRYLPMYMDFAPPRTAPALVADEPWGNRGSHPSRCGVRHAACGVVRAACGVGNAARAVRRSAWVVRRIC